MAKPPQPRKSSPTESSVFHRAEVACQAPDGDVTYTPIEPIPLFDMAEAAEALNSQVVELERRISHLPYRVDVAVGEERQGHTMLRLIRRDRMWILEVAEPFWVYQPPRAIIRTPLDPPPELEIKWRRVSEVALVKKAAAIKLVPQLLSAMKAEYIRRHDALIEANKALDGVFAELDRELAAEQMPEPKASFREARVQIEGLKQEIAAAAGTPSRLVKGGQ